MTMKLTSPSFGHETEIPAKHTCEGEDMSPGLSWEGVPEGTKSLALIVDDPDAPDPNAPKMVFVHWVLYNLPPDTSALPENVGSDGLPEGTRQGVTDFGRKGWGGPCPPIGRHRYFFKLYALDTELPDLGDGKKDDVLQAMEGHVLTDVQLVGTYQKKSD